MAAKRHHSSGKMHMMRDGHDSDVYHKEMQHTDSGTSAHDATQYSNARIYREEGDAGRYQHITPERRREIQDSYMISEDPRAIANLPQHAMIKNYEKTGPYIFEGLDDTIKGVDSQMDYDDSQRKRTFAPKKV